MSSIIQNGDTFHGISIGGRGVFTFTDKYGYTRTYAGQHRGGYACGLGVLTYPLGDKEYAEHGPDGKYDGRRLYRYAHGDPFYWLYERGKAKDWASVLANSRRSRCTYTGVPCAPDDPRLLALIAQVAPVEVRPASQAFQPPLAPQAIARLISRLVLPPQALAKATATEVLPHAARCR
jgi:hypothetical protein